MLVIYCIFTASMIHAQISAVLKFLPKHGEGTKKIPLGPNS